MRNSVPGLGLAFALLAAAPAGAQTAPDGLVWMVLRDINEAAFDRDDPTNRPPLVTRVPAGAIRRVEVSADGHADWLIDYEVAELSSHCGTGGCSKILYVSQGDDGLTRAFDEQAHELAFYEAGGEQRVEAWVHHSFCSGDAGRDCRFAWAWDPQLARLVERPNRAGEAIIPVGAFAPVGDTAGGGPGPRVPGPVADRWFHTRTTCASVYNDDGLEVRRAAIHDIPDIDGDGVRDWVVEPPEACQDQPGDAAPYPGFEIWLTREDGGAVQAWTSPAERYPYIDVSVSPAVLMTRPGCMLDEACPSTALRWDAANGRFIE